MPSTHDEQKLSLFEQAILARLSSRASIAPKDLAAGLAAIGAAGAKLEPAVLQLRRRGLLREDALRRTELGNKALRKALAQTKVPTWEQFRRLLALRALDVSPKLAKSTLGARDGLALAVLRRRAPLPAGSSAQQVADALLRARLGLAPGKITLSGLRQQVLARCLEQPTPVSLASAAAKSLGIAKIDKQSLLDALVCEAFRGDTHVPAAVIEAHPDPALLSLVRDAIAGVGPAGRVDEKVFVSALWHHIAADRRASNLSLEDFKRWLVGANRAQALALARADAVGGMDPRLVAESEIENLGASFHFVVDARHAQAAQP